MASWREIERVRKDPQAVRTMAKSLLKLPRIDFTDWEIDFLESMARYYGADELTARQGEKLVQIRDDAEVISEFRGFSVRLLLKGCWEARLDLSEADEEWIGEMRERCGHAIARRYVGRLMRCARELNLIEEEVAA
jgi:hypothetical protein